MWLKTIEMHCLTVLEAASSKSRCRQGWFLLKVMWKSLSHASLSASGGLLTIFGIPGGVIAPQLLLYLHMVASLCACVSKFVHLWKHQTYWIEGSYSGITSSSLNLQVSYLPIGPHSEALEG